MGYFDAAIKRQQEENELAHHGILGQKWGVRRFQNYDGTRIKKGGLFGKKKNAKYPDIDLKRFKNDQAYADSKAHELARKANKDNGDNYKVYRDAILGDKKAQEVVDKWERGDRLPNDGKVADKATTFIGDADKTFSFLSENIYEDLTNFGRADNASNFNKSEIKEIIRSAFDGSDSDQRKFLKMTYSAEVTRFMEEESFDPASSQVFKNVKPESDDYRKEDLLSGDDWGTERADEWKSYIEDTTGQSIKSLSKDEKAEALKESGLYYTDSDIDHIKKYAQ